MHPDLFAYQREGAEWMADHWSPNVLLGDGMGLGKSCQSIAGSDLVGAKSVLVLCPGIARVNWAREYARWQTEDRSIGIVTGSDNVPNKDVVVASYSILPFKGVKKLLSRNWDLIICDEAHFLKQKDSIRCKQVYGHGCRREKGLSSKSKRTWLLSGTPIPNNLSEFWTHSRALFPEAVAGLERYRQWLDHFCVYEDTEYGTRIMRSQNQADFIRRVKPYVLRRKFDDIFKDMPKLRISQVVVQPETLPPRPEGVAETEVIVKAALAKASGGMSDDAKQIIQAAKDFHLSTLRKWTGIAKAQAVADQLCADFADGMDKIVVFAVHTETIDILARSLPRCGVIDGRTPMAKRDGIIDAFQGRIPGRVIDSLVVHIDIASTALTLTAACQVAFAEVTWVPKDLQQAIARCRRIGQTRPVLARIFSLKGSVDEQIGASLSRKVREISQVDEALAA
jgi:SWI/SNF-related matrix-associated actin-dependent regulator 1 of chromatin subfamily A